jgi:hypothetical protein
LRNKKRAIESLRRIAGLLRGRHCHMSRDSIVGFMFGLSVGFLMAYMMRLPDDVAASGQASAAAGEAGRDPDRVCEPELPVL